MDQAAIIISSVSLLFAISGFVLGLLGYIQGKAAQLSTHTVQYQPQEDISKLFADLPPPAEDQSFEVPNEKLEETILKGFE